MQHKASKAFTAAAKLASRMFDWGYLVSMKQSIFNRRLRQRFCFTVYWYFWCTAFLHLSQKLCAVQLNGTSQKQDRKPQPVKSCGLLLLVERKNVNVPPSFMGLRIIHIYLQNSKACLLWQKFPKCVKNAEKRGHPKSFEWQNYLSGKHKTLAFTPHFTSLICRLNSFIKKSHDISLLSAIW